MKKLLNANRGEIAIRIARSAAEQGLVTVAVYAEDDALSLHTRQADAAVALSGVVAALLIQRGWGADRSSSVTSPTGSPSGPTR